MSGAHAALRDVKNFAEEKSYNAAVYHDKCFDLIPGADTITWDGDTTGKIVVDVAGMQYIKLSDAVPVSEDVSDWSAVFSDGTNSSGPYLDMNGVKRFGTNDAMIVIVTEEAFNNIAFNETFGETGTGVYFSLSNGVYPVSFTLPGYNGFHYKKLKLEHLPEHEHELPEHSHYWNEVSNRPFNYIPSDTLTWDGDTTGRSYVDLVSDGSMMLYHVSDAVPTQEDFANGGSLSGLSSGGIEEISFSFVSDNVILSPEGALMYVEGLFFVAPNDNFILTDESTGDEVTFEKKGVYFIMDTLSGMRATSLTINGYTGFTTEKINPECLYQPDWSQNDDTQPDYIKNRTHWIDSPVTTSETTLEETTFDGFADGSYQVSGTLNLVEGAECIVTWDGVDYTSTCMKEVADATAYLIGNAALMNSENEDNGQPFCIIYVVEYGMYGFMSSDLEATSHTVKIVSNITTQEIHKLDDKYIDAAWLAKSPVYEAVLTVPETTVTTDTEPGLAGLYQSATPIDADITLINGKSIINVKIDGVDYTSNMLEIYFGNTTILMAGSYIGGDPYLGIIQTDGIILCFTTAGDHVVELTVKNPTYNQLPSGYIKDSISDILPNLNIINASGTGSVRTVNANDTTAKNAFAEGYQTTATGNYSHAEGYSYRTLPSTITNSSTNDEIIAEWNTTKFMLAKYGHAEGDNTLAIGINSHAEGTHTIASGMYSHAEGCATIASGQESHAEGSSTTASGMCSHAEGIVTTASGADSHAEGQNTTACCHASHSEGYNTIASSDYQHVQGKYNIEDASNTYAHIVGNGNDASARSNAHTLDWDGNAWFAGNISIAGNSIVLADAVTGTLYAIQIQNGQLVSFPVTE